MVQALPVVNNNPEQTRVGDWIEIFQIPTDKFDLEAFHGQR